MARCHSWRPGVASIWQRIRSTADPDSYLLVYVDPFSPRSLPIKFSPGRPEQAILISGILIALAAAPRLATDTAPTFTSAIFPQGIHDTFTITTSGDPVAKITSSGKLPGVVKFVDNGDGTATLSGRSACVRALGPSLAQFGVPNPLADPRLGLYDGNGTLIMSNDNWKDS